MTNQISLQFCAPHTGVATIQGSRLGVVHYNYFLLQVEIMLDDTYKRFVLDASKVRGAQQVLNRAWEDMYHKLTASYSEDGHRDKAVAGL